MVKTLSSWLIENGYKPRDQFVNDASVEGISEEAAEGIADKLSKDEFDSLVTAINTDPETFLKFLNNVKDRVAMP